MIAVLDACVLFPTVLRELLIGLARQGAYTPLWSARILEEWQHAAARQLGPEAGVQAQTEVLFLKQSWPEAQIEADAALLETLWLPDPADCHVLAAALTGKADVIVTFNLRDFPSKVLRGHGVSAIGPDAFLLGFYNANPAPLRQVVADVLARANALSGETFDARRLLKKARLPRLAKAMA